MTRRPAASTRDDQRGQILPLFVLSMIVILSIGALVLDGAAMLVTRRHLQNAGDAAALAGANIIQKTGSGSVCSNTAGPPPGSPRSDIVTAVTSSLASNYPGLVAGNISVTCPNGWDNAAVQVDLNVISASYLGGAIGFGARTVATTSIAVNGQIAGSNYSVVLLDPSTASQQSTWPNGRKGCPSMLISGGPTIQFDGSVIIDSACTAANGGGLAANGSAAVITMASGKTINIVGGYTLGPLIVTPAPVTGATYIPDPLITLDPISTAQSPMNPMGLTQQSGARLVLNNTTEVLNPGIYVGGIQLKNSSVALLRPGVYVLQGGGLDIGAQAAFCSISSTSTATNCSSFATDCPDAACGVLILNKGTASGSTAMGQVTVGSGSTLKLRAYDERAVASGGDYQYRNILLWQDSTPAASSSYAQPVVALSGGGNVDISGTVYAPQAKVQMGGNSGGSGGLTVNSTLQFIAWDFEISGNALFHFLYSDADFARPKDYGLVK